MIPLALDEVGRLAPGRLVAARGASEVTGLEVDSRRIGPGDLFVAIGGGADFVEDALARGAAAALVPDEPFAALAAIGRTVRERSTARVVGITGSTGKTSTKDVLAALCEPHARTVFAEGSHNNEIGLPLTLSRIDAATEIAILEMGMRGLGQIAELCAIARPSVAVITNVGPAHLELLGTVERVAEAKAEIVAALPPGGTVVVPAAEPLLAPYLSRGDIRTIEVGEGADVSLLSLRQAQAHAEVEVELLGQRLDLRLSVRSRHAVTNALFALGAYAALDLPLEQAAAGAGRIALSRWRDEEVGLPGGGLLLADCYNANPTSMRAALAHLAEVGDGRRLVAVLGDMAELGPEGPGFHAEVGAVAAASGVAVLVAVGDLARGYLDGASRAGGLEVVRWAPNALAAVEAVEEVVRQGDAVLVKASRAIGLETVADAICGRATGSMADSVESIG